MLMKEREFGQNGNGYVGNQAVLAPRAKSSLLSPPGLNANPKLNENFSSPVSQTVFRHNSHAMEEFGQAREVEERIHHALEGFDNGNFKTLRDAADKHHVPYTRIYARYHVRPSKIGRPGTNKRLNPEQEAALRLYIRRCDEIGYSALPHM